MSTQRAYTLFATADNAWHAELIRIFGRRHASNVRYSRQGHGEPGSNLRVLFDNREAARAQWESLAFPRNAALAS